MMNITQCRINHLQNPLGYEMRRASFSWAVENARGTRQSQARIVVSAQADLSSPLYDTGFAALDSLGCELPIALSPRTRFYWQVSVRTDAGEEAASDIQWFETAKQNEPWQAKWITCERTPAPSYQEITAANGPWPAEDLGRLPIFSTKLPLRGQVASARMYICGLGLYEAYVAGQRVGNEFLTPGCNNYSAWQQYQTYDITSALSRGSEVSVGLGDGWYAGRFGFETDRPSGYYGHDYRLLCEIRVTYQGGGEDVFGTDESWQVTRSPITFATIYDGEHMDTTLPPVSPVPAQVCGSLPGTLCARYSLPMTVVREFTPTLLTTPLHETVLDVGQNITGIFRLRVQEKKGTLIHLQFGEVLQSGCFYRDNLRSAKAEYYFVADGTPQTIQPRFTFYGYRYVKVIGVSSLRAEDFTALALTSALEDTGSLSTGHALINRLIENTLWGRRDNFLDVPTDCPQRDERMGWTGDAQVFAPTACYQADAYAFYRKFLHDMETEQNQLGGMVPVVVPCFGLKMTSCAWSDAAVIMPMTLYRFYGDPAILREQYNAMKAWVDYMTKADGSDAAWRRSFHYGDWLALDVAGADAGNCWGETDVGFLADVYYMHSAELVAQAARILEKEQDAEAYQALADRIRQRILHEYYTPSGRCAIATQTALLLTLRHRLSDPRQTRDALLERFRRSQGKLQTGFVGAPLMCGILSENDLDDLAVHLLLNEDYPGWLHEVKLGATTVWERWNSLDDDGMISSTGMNSLNHYAYGSIVQWMYERLAGLTPAAPGFREVLLRPLPVWELGHLDCRYQSAAGVWEIHWNILDESHVTVRVKVPFGASARLRLQGAVPETFDASDNPMFARMENGECLLSGGEYAVTYHTCSPLKKERFRP